MYENQVWDLVIPPEGVKPIECKWIFKRKTNADGNVTIHKARLVAKGFRQVQGVDYDETFLPVAMLKFCADFTSNCCIFRLCDMADGCQDNVP